MRKKGLCGVVDIEGPLGVQGPVGSTGEQGERGPKVHHGIQGLVGVEVIVVIICQVPCIRGKVEYHRIVWRCGNAT